MIYSGDPSAAVAPKQVEGFPSLVYKACKWYRKSFAVASINSYIGEVNYSATGSASNTVSASDTYMYIMRMVSARFPVALAVE